MTKRHVLETERIEREQRLDDLIVAYLELVESGGEVSAADWIARFPEFGCELREFIEQRQSLEQVAAPLRAVTQPALSEVKHRLGDFQIVREIGRGGMGIVYEAHQLSLGRRVALKTLPFAAMLDPRQLQRFKNEAQAAASLEHPHIVNVFFVGCERGVHFYAMRYVDGLSLAEVIMECGNALPLSLSSIPSLHGSSRPRSPSSTDSASSKGDLAERTLRQAVQTKSESTGKARTDQGKKWNVSESGNALPHSKETLPIAALSTQYSTDRRSYYRSVAQLGIQAAEALEYAHQMGIVHRDIKPSNLLLDHDGRLWITDFGLAMTQTGSNLTMTGDVLGTLRYMSPEQASGSKLLDRRSDIYSLGATMYELLTLRPAFDGYDRQVLLTNIAESDPDASARWHPRFQRIWKRSS